MQARWEVDGTLQVPAPKEGKRFPKKNSKAFDKAMRGLRGPPLDEALSREDDKLNIELPQGEESAFGVPPSEAARRAAEAVRTVANNVEVTELDEAEDEDERGPSAEMLSLSAPLWTLYRCSQPCRSQSEMKAMCPHRKVK